MRRGEGGDYNATMSTCGRGRGKVAIVGGGGCSWNNFIVDKETLFIIIVCNNDESGIWDERRK